MLERYDPILTSLLQIAHVVMQFTPELEFSKVNSTHYSLLSAKYLLIPEQ
jgi:hypothetical protein